MNNKRMIVLASAMAIAASAANRATSDMHDFGSMLRHHGRKTKAERKRNKRNRWG